MTTVNKEKVIDGWEYVLEHGRPTLSLSMYSLIQNTLYTLKDGPQTLSRKVLNTWTDMLVREEVPPSMRKQVQDSLILLRRIVK